jgi:hypothetical protein
VINIKRLKPIVACHQCPLRILYTDGSSGCSLTDADIKNRKVIHRCCPLPKGHKNTRIPIIDYCCQCKHHTRGYSEYDTGYQEWICNKYKFKFASLEGEIPEKCKLRDYKGE